MEVNMIDSEECARRLRAAREATGLTQGQAAERLGIKRPTYTQYEVGRRVPSWVTLYHLIEKLGLNPAIIFPEYVAAKKGGKK
jgi:transcriptional regulator with XRE-family HTH domain